MKKGQSAFPWKSIEERMIILLSATNQTNKWWAEHLTRELGVEFTTKQIERFKQRHGIKGKRYLKRVVGTERKKKKLAWWNQWCKDQEKTCDWLIEEF